MELILRNLAPNRTASIQLYQRGTNTVVGSPIVGSSSGYDYTFLDVPVGDFDYELIGFTALPGSRRALRITETYAREAPYWWMIEIAGGVVPGVDPPVSTGVVPNVLSVDYEDDWQYIDGIEGCGYEFGSSRVTSATAPMENVACKRGPLTKNEVIVAASTIGYDATDCTFVIFAQTLTSGGIPFEPLAEDKIIAFDATWIIKSVKRNGDLGQWRCVCRRSALKQI